MGVEAFGESLLVIPRVLAENSGYDIQDTVLELLDAYKKDKVPVGINVEEKGVISPEKSGIYDNYIAKK